jgi:hypothetical protein
MRIILFFTLLFAIFSTTFAQNTVVVVKKSFTKTADVNDPKVTEIASKVNITKLSEAMQANYSLERKDSLTVHLAFYNKEYIGALKLKSSNPYPTLQYTQQWLSSYTEGNHILFLFSKEKDQDQFKYDTLEVSYDMQDQHLFTEVMDFIRANLSGSPAQVVENGTRFLANAIKPVWDKNGNKMDAAEIKVQKDKYKANRVNFFHEEWKSTFLDLELLISVTSNHIRVFFKKAGTSDTLKPLIPIYADKTIFTEGVNIVAGFEYQWNFLRKKFFNYSLQEDVLILEVSLDTYSNHEDYIIPLVEALGAANLFSDNLKVSQWVWSKSADGPPIFTLSSSTGLREKNYNDKFLLIKRKMEDEFTEGEPIPLIHPWFPRTFCNIYASDLARENLFPGVFSGSSGTSTYAPWGPHTKASYIHDVMAISDKFVALKNGEDPQGFVEAWKRTNAGYVVYLSAYNRKYYTDPKPKNLHSGHIATCFPTENFKGDWRNALIIQAGTTSNKINFCEEWKNANFSNGTNNGNRQKVHAHLYLGYILNEN